MNDLIKILKDNNIKYLNSIYGYENKSIIIKGKKYQIEIFEDEQGLASDLGKIPYTWGRMGKTTIEEIIEDLKEYLKIEIKYKQINIFDEICGGGENGN